MTLRSRHPRTSVDTLAELFGRSRDAYYKHDAEKLRQKKFNATFILDSVREIRKDAPMIGGYKLFLMLQSLYPDRMMGRDSFYRLLHRNHLMLKPVGKRHTTDSNHRFHKWKNLVKGFVPDAPRQLFVADITYIETDEGVCYLHLVTDAYTHEIVGWILSETLHAVHTLSALQDAVERSSSYDLSRLIHHSDRGIQYCCNLYVEYLQSIGSRISMTEDYKPTDNAIAERVNGIIKSEWLYVMQRPKDIGQAREVLDRIIDFYNTRRPHMSINMKTPLQMRTEYEAEHGIAA